MEELQLMAEVITTNDSCVLNSYWVMYQRLLLQLDLRKDNIYINQPTHHGVHN